MIHLVFGVRRAEANGTKGWAAWVAAREEQWAVSSTPMSLSPLVSQSLSYPIFRQHNRFGLAVLAGCVIDILANLFVLPLLGAHNGKRNN
jgi:hypothetical protein